MRVFTPAVTTVILVVGPLGYLLLHSRYTALTSTDITSVGLDPGVIIPYPNPIGLRYLGIWVS